MSTNTDNKKVDIPEPVDTPSLFLKSLKKISIVSIGYVLMIVVAYVLFGLFGNSKAFIFLYGVSLIFILSGIGTYDTYIFSNILTGLSLAFGLQLMDPMRLVGLVMVK